MQIKRNSLIECLDSSREKTQVAKPSNANIYTGFYYKFNSKTEIKLVKYTFEDNGFLQHSEKEGRFGG